MLTAIRPTQDQAWRERPTSRSLALLLSAPQGTTICHEVAARMLESIPGRQGASWPLLISDPCTAMGHAEAISFVTQVLVARGYWRQQTADLTLYGGALNGTGHERDLTTYLHYAGTVPGYPEAGGFPQDGAASRAWFARLLWNALRDQQ